MTDKKYTTFIDNAGRTVFGEEVSKGDFIQVKSPVMITVQPQQDGQMAVQLFPLFFPEFIQPVGEDAERSTVFSWSVNNIALGSDFEIEPRIVEQYEKVVNPVLVPVEASADEVEDAEVIKLFDDGEKV
jgi:hypothetical protein